MRFPLKENAQLKSRGICCVLDCGSKKNTNLDLSFHKVPDSGKSTITRINLFGKQEVVDKRQEWLRRLKVKDGWKKELLICSLHFDESDYYLPDLHADKRILRINAVPKDEKTAKKAVLSDDRRKRIEQRKVKTGQSSKPKYKQQKHQQSSSNSKQQSETFISDLQSKTSPSEHQHSSSSTNQQCGMSTLEHQHSSCSTNQECRMSTLEHQHSSINTNQQCRMSTLEHQLGSSSVNLQSDTSTREHHQHSSSNTDQQHKQSFLYEDYLNKLELGDISAGTEPKFHDLDCKFQEASKMTSQSVQVTSGDFLVSFTDFIQSELYLITMCNIKSFKILDELIALMDEIYPPKRVRHFTTRESIILTLVKLKLDLPFNALAILFHRVSQVTIRNLFYTVKKLSTILQCVVTRVSKEEIERNMPKCFRKFKDTVAVYDCTEIKMQTPKCFKCRVRFYSYYKGGLTIKFMTEVSPAGLLTFVSESFGGRAHDKNIFMQSGVLNEFEPKRDAVMVDKGFLISTECMERRIQLYRPPFMKNKTQFTETEATRNRDIACARVHIERMNHRIKLFRILNNTVPSYFINFIDDIFAICCGIANLVTPILADDKFM